LQLPVGTNYPTNYKVSDGVTVGGVIATGVVSGQHPIRIQPTISGVGRLKHAIFGKILVTTGGTAGKFQCGFGTTASSTNPVTSGNFPLWPYIGVGHDLTPATGATDIDVPANTTVSYTFHRIDIVDNDFMGTASDPQFITTYPNWQMNTCSTAGTSFLLFPAICPIFSNTGSSSLTVSAVHCIAFSM